MRYATRRKIYALLGALLPIALLLWILNGWIAPALLSSQDAINSVILNELIPSKIPGINSTLPPNMNDVYYEVEDFSLSTNETGFRTHPFAPKGDTPRIVLLGDSIAFGYFLKHPQTLAAHLEKDLQDRGVSVEVFNLGIPTLHMNQKVAAYEQIGKALTPDVVILQTKPGDLSNFEPLIVPVRMRKYPLLVWIRYRWYRHTYREADWHEGASDFHRLAAQCRQGQTPLLAILYPYLVEEPFDPHWQRTRDVLAGQHIPVVDVAAVLARSGRKLRSFRVAPDDTIHPNGDAHALVSRELTVELMRILGDRSAATGTD